MDILDDLIVAVKDFTDDIEKDVRIAFDDTWQAAQEVYTDVSDKVTSFFEPVIERAEEIVSPMIDAASDFIDVAIGRAGRVYDDIEEIVSGIAEGAANTAKTIADAFTGKVDPDIEAAIAGAQEVTNWTEDRVRDYVNDRNSQAGKAADGASDKAKEGAKDTVTTITKYITEILPNLNPMDLDFLLQLIPGFEAILKPLIEGVTGIGETIEQLRGVMPGEPAAKLGSDIVYTAGLGFNIGQGFSKAETNQVGSGLYDTLVASAGSIGALVGSPMGILPVLTDAYAASLGAHVQNRARLISTPGRVGVSELAAALWRGYIDSPAATRQAGEQGLDPDNFNIMVDLARQLLGANEVITLMLRSEITDLEAADRLSKLGYNFEDIKHIKTLSKVIPGVQDLIRMAVREAFSPEIAEKFGQYEDYPADLTKYAAQIGLTEEWAKRYWASHWDLPGVQLGFEMLHRGVIDQTELSMLLRASDVMPFWRDKLIQISYSPYTRVDIRRMHKLKILDDKEVDRAYRDIGYAPDKAAKLTAFTVELNSEETKIEQAQERDLTLSMIKGAYQDGMLDDQDLTGMVTELGFDQTEVDLIVGREQYKRQLKIRRKQIEIIKMRVMYNKISLNGAIDQMNKIGLPEHEVRYQILDLQMDLELRDAKAEAKAQAAAEKAAAKAAAQ